MKGKFVNVIVSSKSSGLGLHWRSVFQTRRSRSVIITVMDVATVVAVVLQLAVISSDGVLPKLGGFFAGRTVLAASAARVTHEMRSSSSSEAASPTAASDSLPSSSSSASLSSLLRRNMRAPRSAAPDATSSRTAGGGGSLDLAAEMSVADWLHLWEEQKRLQMSQQPEQRDDADGSLLQVDAAEGIAMRGFSSKGSWAVERREGEGNRDGEGVGAHVHAGRRRLVVTSGSDGDGDSGSDDVGSGAAGDKRRWSMIYAPMRHVSRHLKMDRKTPEFTAMLRHRDFERVLQISLTATSSSASAPSPSPAPPPPQISSSSSSSVPPSSNGTKPGAKSSLYKLGGAIFPYGLYYVDVSLGSPPQKFSVGFDTGSNLLWVQCDCIQCDRESELTLSEPYSPSASSSAASLPCASDLCPSGYTSYGCDAAPNLDTNGNCEYLVKYGDGSTSEGVLISDDFDADTVASGMASSRIVFGCGRIQGGNLITTKYALDGLMGFGVGEVSVSQQLQNEGVLPFVFSFCLDGDGGGHLIMGTSPIPQGMNFTDLFVVSGAAYHYVKLRNFAIGGNIVPGSENLSDLDSLKQGGVIIDSGTTFTAMNAGLYDAFRDTVFANPNLNRVSSPDTGDCVDRFPNDASLFEEYFPHVIVQFENSRWDVPPLNYLYVAGRYSDNTIMVCLAAIRSPEGASHINLIIGESWLQNFYILMDQESGRFGWFPTECASDTIFTPEVVAAAEGFPPIPPSANKNKAPPPPSNSIWDQIFGKGAGHATLSSLCLHILLLFVVLVVL